MTCEARAIELGVGLRSLGEMAIGGKRIAFHVSFSHGARTLTQIRREGSSLRAAGSLRDALAQG